MPRRWPRAARARARRARARRARRARGCAGASSGSGGAASVGRAASLVERRRRRRSARPRPSITRPSRSSPTGDAELAAGGGDDVRPGRCPCISPSGISSVRPARKPTTSAGTGAAPRPRLDLADLADLGLQPGGLDDQADQVRDAAVAAVQVGAADGLAPGARCARRRATPASSGAELMLEHLARALRAWSRACASTSPSSVRTMAPPRGDAALGLHLAVLDAAELGDEARRRGRGRGRGRRG